MSASTKEEEILQLFQVRGKICDKLTIKVIEGKGITKGRFEDFFDIPDPYVSFTVAGHAIQRTKTINNDYNPKWKEEIVYYLPPKTKPEGNKATPIEITLYDDNYKLDGQIGEKVTFDAKEIGYNNPTAKTFKFGNGKVVMEFKREKCNAPDHHHTHSSTSHKEEAIKAATKQDPFQLFRVHTQLCDVLTIKVIKGKNVTKGPIKDFFDTPDPYVQFNAVGQIDAIKRTKTIDNDMSPEWNEEIVYFLPPKNKPEGNKATPIEITLYDDNYKLDGKIGRTVTFDVNEIGYNNSTAKKIKFGIAEVNMEFRREVCKKQDVRLSLALCDEEKTFRASRKEVAFKALQKLLGADGPRTLKETPTIALMGSGGGYRAMIGFYGVLKALEEMGILDTTMYTTGLSGSTWCLSTLYANTKFPREGVQPAADVVKANIGLNPLWILRPSNLMQMLRGLMAKHKATAQPVTLTDLFGCLVGEHLFGKKLMNSTNLSQFKGKIRDGKAPMPIMASLHVKNDVSALVYHDWIEFTPYEIGMSKYGTFVPTKDFNHKYFMGTMTKNYEEEPLYFLMGVWGSAFSILLKRVFKPKKKPTHASPKEEKSVLEAAAATFKKKKAHENEGKDSDHEDDDTKEDNERKDAAVHSLPAWGDAVHTLVGDEIKKTEIPPPSNEDEKTRNEQLYGNGGLFGNGSLSDMFKGLYKKIFEVRGKICDKLTIKVIEGKGITKGRFEDFFDIPDPYVSFTVAGHAIQRTKTINNDYNPKWKEEIVYYLPPKTKPEGNKATPIEITLYDDNYKLDGQIGEKVTFDAKEIGYNNPTAKTFKFGNGKVVMEFKREKCNAPDHHHTHSSTSHKEEAIKAATKQDPFQLFRVHTQLCDVLTIKVIKGKNVTKGPIKDFFDTPDPYVQFNAVGQIDAIKRTKTIDNDMSPEWNEEIVYFLPPKNKPEGNKATPIEITLYDDNYKLDGKIGRTVTFDVNEIGYNNSTAKKIKFGIAEVNMEFRREVCKKQDVRLSLALCDEEKTFRASRKEVAFKALQKLLGADGPRTLKETPTIALMGSGGGYRAMIGFYGVLKALEEMGILDTTMYTTGLSGSTWCLSTLYANTKFPREGVQPAADVVKANIGLNPLWILRPSNLMQMLRGLMAKHKATAQPVTLTDLFGCLVGEHLFGKKLMNSTNLSQFKGKIRDGKAPMPIMASLHVKNDVSALVYHDWIEFTPYEIGMSKYGTFVPTKDFNHKYFMGTMTKNYEEEPLYFLMGVWGSAFSILLKRVFKPKKKPTHASPKEEKSVLEAAAATFKKKKAHENEGKDSDHEDDDTKEDNERKDAAVHSLPAWGDAVHTLVGDEIKKTEIPPPSNEDEKTRNEQLYGNGGLFGNGSLSDMFKGLYKKIFESRSFTAGKVLNFMRGFTLTEAYPFNPFETQQKTVTQVNEFEQLGESISPDAKKVFVVDAGLAFNSPYPGILRPQRKVDVIISADFSARDSDETQPFQELLLAEKWANIHKVPFPKIDTSVFKKNEMKECYVFRDDKDDRAPIVMHFVLANVNFRKFSAPGVPRAADDKSGDFNIFGKNSPYSSFDFHYTKEQFDNLFELMRFNTLLNKDNIIAQLKKSVATARKNPNRWNLTKADVSKSKRVHADDKKKVEAGTVDTSDSYY